MGIKAKLLIPTIVLIAVSIAAVLLSAIAIFGRYVNRSMEQEARISARIVQAELESLQDSSYATAYAIAGDPEIHAALLARDRERLVLRAVQLQDDLQFSASQFCGVFDGEGTVLYRSHDPLQFGDSMATWEVVSTALQGQSLSSIEDGVSMRMGAHSGVPIRDDSGRILGVVTCGYRLDHEEFVDAMKDLLECEVTLLSRDERIATTLLNADGSRAVDFKADADVADKVLSGQEYTGKIRIQGRQTYVAYLPIYGSDGGILGMVFAGLDASAHTSAVVIFLLEGLAIALILIAVATAAVYIIAGRIVSPLKAMVEVADNLSEGNVDLELKVDADDEVNHLALSFSKIIDSSRQQARAIEAIASGDLSGQVRLRSDKDVVGRALNTMLELNNGVFTEIICAVGEVFSTTEQVSQSAQQLAHNNSEDSSAILHISQVMAELADKASQSLEKSRQASQVEELIRTQAQSGERQMALMTEAVGQIVEASRSISRVISTIDDIAFQTNILALNASVEAARAGREGSGFAIVAQEVRKLANLSADAARDTSELIVNTMSKASLGAEIADETSRSFSRIVEEVSRGTDLLQEISRYAREQEAKIERLNTSVQNLSRTAESTSSLSVETAASSQQMASQARFLQDLVGRFKLRDRRSTAVGSALDPWEH